MTIRDRIGDSVDDSGHHGADGGAPSPRIDWRFLLPRAALGRVAVHGPASPDLLAALASGADHVTELPSGATESFDTVVAVSPRDASLASTMRAVVPGGVVRIENPSIRDRRRIQRRLRRAGFMVSTWWSRPSTIEARCLIALDHPQAAATVLRTVAGRGRRAGFEARFAASGLAQRFARDVSLIAIAPGEAGRPDNRPALAAPAPGTTVAGLITPRFAASRAVVGVTTDESGRALAQVVKIARARTDQHFITSEGEVLDQFVTQSTGPLRVPGNHRLVDHCGHVALVEDAAPGRPLDRPLVRRDPAAALQAGRRWLEQVPVTAPTQLTADGRYQQLLTKSLDTIAAMEPRDPDGRRDKVRRALSLLEPLASANLPAVFEHGDFSHPNLFLQDNGDLVVIDWEQARPEGLPLHDLTFFVAYLVESVAQPHDPAALVASHRRAMSRSGWAQADVHLHAERMGIDPRHLPRLALACWTRALASLASTPAVTTRPTPHRYEILWEAALEDAEERRR